jgi:uncharacterized membrane protein HdeD (DUF308 family)
MTILRSLARESLGWLIGTGVLLVLAGFCAIFFPFAAGLAADTTIGILIILGGISHFALAWNLRHIGGALWEALVGVVYVVGGFVLLVYPITGLVTLTTVLAIYLSGSALVELLVYFGLRFLPGSGWLLFNCIITFILAIMVLRQLPVSAVWLPGTLVGFAMLSSGISRLVLAFAAKRAMAVVTA